MAKSKKAKSNGVPWWRARTKDDLWDEICSLRQIIWARNKRIIELAQMGVRLSLQREHIGILAGAIDNLKRHSLPENQQKDDEIIRLRDREKQKWVVIGRRMGMSDKAALNRYKTRKRTIKKKLERTEFESSENQLQADLLAYFSGAMDEASRNVDLQLIKAIQANASLSQSRGTSKRKDGK